MIPRSVHRLLRRESGLGRQHLFPFCSGGTNMFVPGQAADEGRSRRVNWEETPLLSCLGDKLWSTSVELPTRRCLDKRQSRDRRILRGLTPEILTGDAAELSANHFQSSSEPSDRRQLGNDSNPATEYSATWVKVWSFSNKVASKLCLDKMSGSAVGKLAENRRSWRRAQVMIVRTSGKHRSQILDFCTIETYRWP